MTDNNTSNLPILDDIIKPGDAAKQADKAGNTDQNRSWRDDDNVDPANDQHRYDMPADHEVPSTADNDIPHTQAQPLAMPDIEALTEEILDSMLPELEQVLREKIWLALGRHFPGDTDPD